jgi:hypothetical protein
MPMDLRNLDQAGRDYRRAASRIVATCKNRLAGTLAPPITAKLNYLHHGINFFSDQQN